MKASELRALSTDELRARLEAAYEELYKLRVSHRIGQLKNTARLRELRGDIARIKTILRERELQGEA